jgi:Fur family ferric uptake transcriptional regulator
LSLNKRKEPHLAQAIREEEVFRTYLSERALRMTEERRAILTAVLRTHRHFDVDELSTALRKSGRRVSRATIYRTLDHLVESGLAIRHDFGDNNARYEHAYGRLHHDHMVCLHCGEIEEFENPEIEALQERVSREHSFELTRHTMLLFGRCRNCAPGGDRKRTGTPPHRALAPPERARKRARRSPAGSKRPAARPRRAPGR